MLLRRTGVGAVRSLEDCHKFLIILLVEKTTTKTHLFLSCSDLIFLTMSPVPGTIIIGRFSQGAVRPSLFSEPSEALELLRDEALLEVREHLR